MQKVLAGLLLLVLASLANAGCVADNNARDALLALKQSGFEISDNASRQAQAIQLLDCLAEPDPIVRDGVAFEALSTWMRADLIDAATLATLRTRLLESLRQPDDAQGLRHSFGVLTLSEVARVDRLTGRFEPAQRREQVDACLSYFVAIKDFRGFDETVGWRHQVAHGSDWILQLAINGKIKANDVARLMDGLALKIAPSEHAYRFGEPERLARAVFFTYQRGVLADVFWDGWFARLVRPAQFADWTAASKTVAGLTLRHNLTAFLLALNMAATAREGAEDTAVRRRVMAALEVISG